MRFFILEASAWITGQDIQSIMADGDGLWLGNWSNPMALFAFELISLAAGSKRLIREVCVTHLALKKCCDEKSRLRVTTQTSSDFNLEK